MSNSYNEVAETSHASSQTYMIGFSLAVLFTLISFAFVMIDQVPKKVAFVGLSIAALLQMVVHLRYFLHMDSSSGQRWNVVFLAFAAVMIFIFIGGTLWVMYTLNSRMM